MLLSNWQETSQLYTYIFIYICAIHSNTQMRKLDRIKEESSDYVGFKQPSQIAEKEMIFVSQLCHLLPLALPRAHSNFLTSEAAGQSSGP